MDLEKFDEDLINLLDLGKFDEAETVKASATPWLKSALTTDIDSAVLVLRLLSDLAGDAESFDNFSNLLEELQSEGLITKKLVDELIHASPSNRWL